MFRVEQEPAYVLHRRAYKETSALIEALTLNHGRVSLVGKGAYRSGKRGFSIEPFCALRLSWVGREGLLTLTSLEIDHYRRNTDPIDTLCGLYLNELTVNLVPRHVPNPEFYRCYEDTLSQLSEKGNTELALRKFEFNLLSAIGYGLQLDYDSENDQAVSAKLHYKYHNEKGPIACRPHPSKRDVISGRTLIALRSWDSIDAGMMREIKQILQTVLSYHLNGKRLYTRSIMRYVQRL